MPALNVISPDAARIVLRGAAAQAPVHRAGSLDELRAILDGQPAALAPRSLDLIGHSSRLGKLLELGATPIDMFSPPVVRFFERLAADAVLPRLGLTAVRLLGCGTAVELVGQRTMARLARTLGVPVFGTTKLLMHSHYDARGFAPVFAHLLVEAARLPSPPRRLA